MESWSTLPRTPAAPNVADVRKAGSEMKTFITGAGSYVTGDAIAVALLEYWRTLVGERLADVVEFPFRAVDGSRSRVRITMTSSSSFAAVDLTALDEPELVDAEFVDELASRARARTRAEERPNGHRDPPLDLAGLSFIDGY